MNLLLVDDTDSVRQLLARELARGGATVVAVASFEQGRAELQTGEFDGLVIDMGLPDGDGRDLVRAYRASGGSGPALIITASQNQDDRAEALESGADGLLVKPFGPRELLANLDAVARRRPHPGQVLADLIVGERTVHASGRELDVTEMELRLLRLLVDRRGDLVSRSELITGAWGGKAAAGAFDHALAVHLHNLRVKLQRAGSRVDIVSRRRLGVRVVLHGGSQD